MKREIQWTVGAVLLLVGGVTLLGDWTPSVDVAPAKAGSALPAEEELVPVDPAGPAHPDVGGARSAAPLAVIQTDEPVLDATQAVVEGEILVRVVDGSGRSLTGATVEVVSDLEAGFSDAGFHGFHVGDPIEGMETPTPGLYRADVSPGQAYRVSANADGYARIERSGCFEGSTVEIVLLEGASFQGTVRAAADRVPLEGTMVRVFHGPDLDHVDLWTDEAGRFFFEDLVPGEGAFFVSPRDHRATRYTEIEFVSGATLLRDIEVAAGWSLSGQVRDAVTEAPIEGAEVSAWSFQGAPSWTDANGFYELRGLKTLPGAVHARAPGYAIARASYEADAATVDIRLERSLTVRGLVLDPSRRPLSGFISQRHYRADWPKPQPIAEDGTFQVTGLEAQSTIQLLPRVPGHEGTLFTIDLSGREPNGEGVIELEPMILQPGARVSGQVRWSTGAPVQGARMYLTRLESPEPRDARWVETEYRSLDCDGKGAFRLLEMSAGTWRARILAPGVLNHMETFTVRPGQRLEGLSWILPAAEGSLISGRVTGPDGVPLEHVYVNLRDESVEHGASHYQRTDTQGNFRFEHLLGESYQLFAHADDDTQKKLDLAVLLIAYVQAGVKPDGRHIQVQLRVADLKISGRVLDADGEAVPHAYVCRDEGGGRFSQGVLADEAGVFQFHVDSSGTTSLFAWATQPFKEGAGNLSHAEFLAERSILDYPEKPLASAERSPDGAAVAEPGLIGRIVLD